MVRSAVFPSACISTSFGAWILAFPRSLIVFLWLHPMYTTSCTSIIVYRMLKKGRISLTDKVCVQKTVPHILRKDIGLHPPQRAHDVTIQMQEELVYLMKEEENVSLQYTSSFLCKDFYNATMINAIFIIGQSA